MQALQAVAVFAVAAMAFAAPVRAQSAAPSTPPSSGDSLELTMVLLPESARGPEEIVRRIELPAAAAEQGREASATGRARAAEALAGDERRDGLETAAEARERGREFGQEIAEQARENRENAGRGSDGERPGPPDGPPGGPPDGVGGPQGDGPPP